MVAGRFRKISQEVGGREREQSPTSALLRIGLVDVAGDPGGARSYALAIVETMLSAFPSGIELTLFVRPGRSDVQFLENLGPVVLFDKHPKRQGKRFGFRSTRTSLPGLPQALLNSGIDLAWFMAPNSIIAQIERTPYVVSVWDVGHSDIAGLPEVPCGAEWSRRDSGLSDQVRRALHVFTDSRRTGSNLERMYGLRPEAWTSLGLPLMTKDAGRAHDNVLSRFGDLGSFFYYPATFWAHKNHRVVIDALTFLSTEVRLVFTGGDGGYLPRVKELVADRGLGERVSFLGRVSDHDVDELMKASRGVVMPSALGPTNYPPLEALSLGRWALVSDAHDFDELPETGVRVVDTFDAQAWANAMKEVLTSNVRLSPWEAPFPVGALNKVLRDIDNRLSLGS
jgi:glycosyltransferase involved in cell wall biosynthesis